MAKNKGPLTLSKFFPYLLFFPSTKFWSSYKVWLYIKRTKLHTKRPSLWSPLGWSLLSLSDPFSQIHPSLTFLCRNFTHFAAKYTFPHFPISLTKSLFIDNNTTHILQHTIIHYTLSIFLSSLIFWNFIILLPKDTSSSHSLFHIQNPLLRKQHNPWYNTKNHSSSNYNLIYLLYLIFISFILHFHTYYKHHIS